MRAGRRLLWLLPIAAVIACGTQPGPSDAGPDGTGGASLAGGAPGTGAGVGSGASSGLSGSGGTGPAGGSGGTAGPGTGGASGGMSGGGGASGGMSDGGGMSGGSGGASAGGSQNFEPSFILGADISSTQEQPGVSYIDTDGQTKSLFEVLKNHGFNYIRLRTFVDPLAPGGYASDANGCQGKDEAFGDKAHVIAYGKQAKDHGMGFLLDFHYSDVWADPGNQIIPASWRNPSSIQELADQLAAYTKDVITDAIAAGARPDMVQVGNEITPGLLAHVPNGSTDCWGNNVSSAPIGGSVSNWDNLAALLKAGISAVREVDPDIKVMLHVENTDDLAGVKWWLDGALSRGVLFDVLGLSCYTAFQGEPSVWQNTFTDLVANYPGIEFVIAEYNAERTQANLIMKDLPNGRGLGTFFWEPTLSGDWGSAMFDPGAGNSLVANQADFAEYDQMLADLGL